MQNTKIEWTDHTINFVIGCEKVSSACANCYAESQDARFQYGGHTHWGKNAPRYLRIDAARGECVRYNRKAAAGAGVKVFINSMSDTFEDRADLAPARAALFEEIDQCPNLTFQLLTKRPQNVLSMVPDAWRAGFPANVWIGTTVENQEMDKRIPELLQIPAKVRFLSCEPLLGNLDLWPAAFLPCQNASEGLIQDPTTGQRECCRKCDFTGVGNEPGIHWVICGGESGPNARPMHPTWARSLRDQCIAAGVPFFFKQWGEWAPWDFGDSWSPIDYQTHLFGLGDRCQPVHRVGKKDAGRLLDGREWNEFPA